MAILFGLLGIINFNPILLFIALFVYIGAQQEARQAMLRSVTQGIPVRRAMLTRYFTLDPDDTLDTAVDKLLRGSDQDFPVVKNGEVVGLLTRKRLMQALSEHGRAARVGDLLDSACLTVDDTAMLDEAFLKMQENQCSTVPVIRGGELVGVLTLENIGELLMISSALKQGGRMAAVEAPAPSAGSS
jgi:CBS domain-containing protein